MSRKLELARNELTKLEVFKEYKNRTMTNMTKILGKEVPEHMAQTIANFTMAGFVGHFHFKIKLSENNLIPMNMIAFILAHSGSKKTSSVSKLEKVIQPGLDVINITRQIRMEEKCRRLDIPVPKMNPLSNALATEAGMIKRLNEFKEEGVGLPSMFVDEIATELAVNTDMVPNIKLVAQLFDEGNMKSKPLKDSENQSQEVVGMGMTALFIGSEYGILEDTSILEKFNLEFISKLSRRCFFVYPEFQETDTNAESIDDLLSRISMALKDKDINLRELDDDTLRTYEIYKIYCEELAKEIPSEQINLEQQHRHWKALKLAGVYSIFNLHNSITLQDLKEAIYVAELGANDLERFLVKAERNAHEKLLEHYMEGLAPLTIHEILKKKWVKKAVEIDELLRFANSKLGNVGILKMDGDTIQLERFVETEGVGCTYKICKGTKNERKYKINEGFRTARAPFVSMAKILSNDTAYCAFEFKNGIRGKDTLVGACDYVVLDVDDTDISDIECSDFLADYKHIICRTSNKENPYKYRVILPTDIAVDVPNEIWPHFLKKVGEHVGIDVDVLPKAQIYFGYSDRTPIIQEEGADLEASDIIKTIHVPKVEIKKLPTEKLKTAYRDRLQIFKWFYETGSEAPPGSPKARESTHNTLWLASVHAHDIGLDFTTAEAIVTDINDFRTKKVRSGYMEQLARRMKTYDRWTNAKSIILNETIEAKEDSEYKY